VLLDFLTFASRAFVALMEPARLESDSSSFGLLQSMHSSGWRGLALMPASSSMFSE